MTEAVPPSFQLCLPSPLLEALQTCERICVAGCCGVDAFDADPLHMVPWFRENPGREWLVFDQFSDTARLVGEQTELIWSDELEFNHRWESAAECIAFFREWRRVAVLAFEFATWREFPAIDPGWRTATVLELARGIYDDRAFDRLPILADALQDAGCDDDDVLNHCRRDTAHARGCWVVDAVLGKE